MKAEDAKRLKQLVADLSLDNQMLKHIASGSWRALLALSGYPVRRSVNCEDSSGSPNEGRVACWISRAAVSVISGSRGATSRR